MAQIKVRSNEHAGYLAGRGLRGRKFYPHHRGLPDGYWLTETEWKAEGSGDLSQSPVSKNVYREYIRPKNGKRRDSQNRSVQGWVKKGTAFRFELHFFNLSAVELGAMAWLLMLEPDQYHRMGGGKPLGFGSVSLKLETENSEVRSGRQLRETRFVSLEDPSPPSYEMLTDCIAAFKEAIAASYGRRFEEVSFIDAFIQGTRGFQDGKPTHYPRTSKGSAPPHPPPNPEGESFKWFVKNSKVAQKKIVNGYVLPDLEGDYGLPLLTDD
jgi:hypothetical protein